jgi:hypothetical protein
MGDERAVDRPKDARDAEYLSDTEGTARRGVQLPDREWALMPA